MNETLTIAVVIVFVATVVALCLGLLAGVTALRLVRSRFYREFTRRRTGGRSV